MKFLLVVYMFTLNPVTNQLQDFQVLKQPFETEAACNYAGEHLREITHTDSPKYDVIKTLSSCVSYEDFQIPKI